MKKLVLLLFTIMFAVAAQGAGQFKASHNLGHKANQMIIKKEMPAKQKLVKGDTRNLRNAMGGISRVNTEQPEGEVVYYKRSGNAIYADGDYITVGKESGTVTMVYAEDNKVYINDLLYGSTDLFGDAWIEGTISSDGTTLTIPMEQSIYYSEYYQADVFLAWGSTTVSIDEENRSHIVFSKNDNVSEATYTIDPEAKTITLNNGSGSADPDPYDNNSYVATGLGCYWGDDGSFGGFLAYSTVFTERIGEGPTVITEQPEGELVSYFRYGYCIGSGWTGLGLYEQDGKLNVVFAADGKAYIQNPSWWCDSYDTWVEGTYDPQTGIISVPAEQYLNWSDENDYGIIMAWGKSTIEEGVDDEGEPAYFLNYEKIDTEFIQFKVEEDKIYLLNCEGDAQAEFPSNYVATGLLFYYSDDNTMASLEFNTTGYNINLVPAVPADPTADDWYDCGTENGFSRFYFTLPKFDVDGNPIDPELLSYSIYTDNDNLFTFPAENYTYDLEEDITEVPYSIYSDAVDFHNYYCYLYRTNENDNPLFTSRIGIQVFYTVDGVKNASNIIYWPEGISENSVLVSGTVVDPDGEPLEGVTVTFTPQVEEQPGMPRRAEAVEVTTTTDMYGAFEVEVAPNTDYDVTVTLDKAVTKLSVSTEEEDIDLQEIVLDTTFTGINDINAGKTVSVQYIDAMGHVSDRPFKGVNIVVTRNADGTTSSVKIVK